MKRSLAVVVLTWGLAVFSWPAPTLAQKSEAADSLTLDHVEQLVEAGRADAARSILLKWWSDVRPAASTRDVQRGLWLRARLTVDPEQAALDYRRLAVEYPGGPYSAQALLRLAQSTWEQGDSAGAARYVARLGREYPGSRVRGDADAWLAAAGSPPPPPEGVKEDSVQADSAGDRAGAGEPTVTPGVGMYAVQLGAFSSDARAGNVQRRLRDKGFDARLVHLPGSSLVHVRVGSFDSAPPARQLLKRLEALGFTGAIVKDANREGRNGP